MGVESNLHQKINLRGSWRLLINKRFNNIKDIIGVFPIVCRAERELNKRLSKYVIKNKSNG